LDETEERKDTSPSEKEDTSSGEQGTSEKEPKTFDEKQVETIKQKAVSDALAKAGRDAKSLEQREGKVKVAEERATETRKREFDARLEAARDNPDELTKLGAEQRAMKAEVKLAEVEQELGEEKERGKLLDEKEAKSTKEQNAREIVTRLGVDTKLLIELAKPTDGSTEAIEAKAAMLPKKGEPKDPLRPDSGKTIGGGELPESAKGKMRAGWDELHKS